MSSKEAGFFFARTSQQGQFPRAMYTQEIYRIAALFVKSTAPSKPQMAAKHCANLLQLGELDELMVWKGVLRAVLEIVRTERDAGEQVN